MKKMLALLLLILTGCAQYSYVIHEDTKGIIPMPGMTTAMVVFFRPSGHSANVGSRVYDGDALIGILPGEAYLTYEAKPGTHLFNAFGNIAVDKTNCSFLEAALSPGKTYYVFVRSYDVKPELHVELRPVQPGSPERASLPETLSNLSLAQPNELAFAYEKEKADLIKSRHNTCYQEWLAKPDKQTLRSRDSI